MQSLDSKREKRKSKKGVWGEFRILTDAPNEHSVDVPQRKRTMFAIPAAIYRSAPRPGPESAPLSAFSSNFGHLLFECFSAFSGPKKRQKALKKHSSGHCKAGAQNCSKSTLSERFQARAPGHSCKWRPGSQHHVSKCARSRILVGPS